ncbi:MAG TPA: triose-phosphate isomerase [Thermoanaerobaculia bacterium]|nr:triose-phosphate isomerase [Thermoanaerobaculia bacterium]
MRYLVANWKMNLPPEGMDAWMSTVALADPHDVALVFAPPFPFLRDAFAQRRRLGLAAQNCNDHASGAYTGEVAPSMLRYCGAEYVILGHSERRNIYGESDALIAGKLAIAIDSGLKPILCIGESLEVRDGGRVAEFLSEQIRATAVPELARAPEIVIAYEPVWAIGTGRNASGAMVAETMIAIRGALMQHWNRGVPILYGGSVTPDNVDDLVANGTIDGFLVGGASLDSGKFLAILQGMG